MAQAGSQACIKSGKEEKSEDGPVTLIGWIVLLIWADRAPFERIEVLLITVFPVLAGLIVNDIVGLVSGFLPLMGAIIFLGIQLFLAILFAVAYLMTKRQQ
ncbi:MAG: hypothetical protein ACFE8Z_06245 [Candidatus Hermodarchaeota archaeon]